MKRQNPEQIIHKAVADHLRKRGARGIVWFHAANGLYAGGKRNRKGVAIQAAIMKGLGVRPGVSDIIALHRGRFFAVELKAPGGRLTPAQIEFISDVNSAGGSATAATGLDQALSVLENWGLLLGRVS